MPGGGHHRRYTHRGWDDQENYLNDVNKEHWEKRKKVILRTSYKVFGYEPLPGLLSATPLGDKELEKKLNSFCALIYYVHVLGDYLEDDDYKKFNGKTNGEKIAFARPHPGEDNVDMFYELTKHLETLFSDQKDTRVYAQLIGDIKTLANKARNVVGSTGGINSDEKFEEAKLYVEELMDILSGSSKYANRVHMLLKNEEFFNKAFPDLVQSQKSESLFDRLLHIFGLGES